MSTLNELILPGMNGSSSELAGAASRYAGLGLHVVQMHAVADDGRCSCPSRCSSPGKHPLGGATRSTDDAMTAADWWRWRPDSNVGLRTGIPVYTDENGHDLALLAVDVDGSGSKDGFDSLSALVGEHDPLPSTWTARSGSGQGAHYLFLAPASAAIRAAPLAADVDVKWNNGVLVVAPSVHASGGAYQWTHNASQVLPARAPEWLLELACRDRRPTRGATDSARRTRARPSTPRHRPSPRRNPSSPEPGWDLTDHIMWECLPVGGGSRHQAGWDWACAMRDAGVSREDTEALAPTFWEMAHELAAKDEDRDMADLLRSIKDAYVLFDFYADLRSVAGEMVWRTPTRNVFTALCERGHRQGKSRFEISLRALQATTDHDIKTIRRALGQLVDDGFLDLTQATPTSTTTYNLKLPPSGNGGKSHSRATPSISSSSTDIYSYGSSGEELRLAWKAAGLGACQMTYEILHRTGPQTVKDLAAKPPVTDRTVREHRARLQEAGLVDMTATGELVAVVDPANLLDHLTSLALPGAAERRRRIAERLTRESDAHAEWLARRRGRSELAERLLREGLRQSD